jgi:hypothetical protein
MNMKTVFTVLCIISVACAGIGCKSDDRIDIKTAEKQISADVNRILEGDTTDLGLSRVKLKAAPKERNVTFIGTATFISGKEKIDREILANAESLSLTWWFYDDPDEKRLLYKGLPADEWEDEGGSHDSGEPVPSRVTSVGNTQATNTQSAVTLGKVEQNGTKFTTFDSSGRQITNFSSPNRQLVGWGVDFFVIRSGTSFYTYDARCRQISTVTVGGAGAATVERETFTVKVGSSNQRFKRSCQRK